MSPDADLPHLAGLLSRHQQRAHPGSPPEAEPPHKARSGKLLDRLAGLPNQAQRYCSQVAVWVRCAPPLNSAIAFFSSSATTKTVAPAATTRAHSQPFSGVEPKIDWKGANSV